MEIEPSLTAQWTRRAKLMAAWIPPGSSVLDLGAGPGYLREELPDGCTYSPMDRTSYGPEWKVWNIEYEIPEIDDHDVGVIAGLLEHAGGPIILLYFVANHCNRWLVSCRTCMDFLPWIVPAMEKMGFKLKAAKDISFGNAGEVLYVFKRK